MALRLTLASFAVLLVACGDARTTGDEDAGSPGTEGLASGTAVPDSGASDSDEGAAEAEGRLDVMSADVAGAVPSCKVVDDMNAVGSCDDIAPPNSFTPRIEWTWQGPEGQGLSLSTALVANLTDDNDDGAIDLCDTPDVIVAVHPMQGAASKLYVLDGATGREHFRTTQDVAWSLTPALGDIDGDGLPEIVAYGPNDDTLLAFEHDGSLKWQAVTKSNGSLSHGIALGDVDNDGDVEIANYDYLADHEGRVLTTAQGSGSIWSATVLADLDGDEDLEMLQPTGAWHHDGSEYFRTTGIDAQGHAQVANFDEDDEPEILVISPAGASILEHDGTPKMLNAVEGSRRPAVIHDFTGDGLPEFAFSLGDEYRLYDREFELIWTAPVLDSSGGAAGTAFDFLGDGVAEAMYADEFNMFIFDGSGSAVLEVPRASITHNEYPVVADVDNDGSAEIVVVSNKINGGEPSPTVQVIGDADDRWIQARRIWNQHTYHVTNVREDGTIPRVEPPHWLRLNTFRTNAQIQDGATCRPPMVG